MKSMRLVAAAAFLVLAACSSSATEPAATRADRPSFDGGNGMGSGNATGEDGGDNDGQTTTTSSDSTGTVDGRGINTMGSGG